MALIHKISLLATAAVATATGSAFVGYANRTIDVVVPKEEEKIEKVEVNEKPIEKTKEVPKDCNNKVGWFWTRR